MRRTSLILLPLLFVSVLASLTLSASTTAEAQKTGDSGHRFFLKIDGVDGEAIDADHVGDIAVQSFSWEQTRPGDTSSTVQRSPIHIVLPLDKSSAALLKKIGMRERTGKAVLTARDGSVDYAKWTLSDVIVSSYAIQGTWGLGRPMISVDLLFSKVDTEYRQKLSNGGYSAPIRGYWSLMQ
jgi:type VI secretion system secreted protein Hcp